MTRCALFDRASENDDVATTSSRNQVKKVGKKEFTFYENIRSLTEESVKQITNTILGKSTTKMDPKNTIPNRKIN